MSAGVVVVDRGGSCFSGLEIFARRIVPERAVEIENLTSLRAVSNHFGNILLRGV